eukprot:Nk52_evm22s559 gene=Nk52_evmTU22s559
MESPEEGNRGESPLVVSGSEEVRGKSGKEDEMVVIDVEDKENAHAGKRKMSEDISIISKRVCVNVSGSILPALGNRDKNIVNPASAKTKNINNQPNSEKKGSAPVKKLERSPLLKSSGKSKKGTPKKKMGDSGSLALTAFFKSQPISSAKTKTASEKGVTEKKRKVIHEKPIEIIDNENKAFSLASNASSPSCAKALTGSGESVKTLVKKAECSSGTDMSKQSNSVCKDPEKEIVKAEKMQTANVNNENTQTKTAQSSQSAMNSYVDASSKTTPEPSQQELEQASFEQLISLFKGAKSEILRQRYSSFARKKLQREEPIVRAQLKMIQRVKAVIFPKPNVPKKTPEELAALKEQQATLVASQKEERKRAQEAEKKLREQKREEEKRAKEEERLRRKKEIEEERLKKKKEIEEQRLKAQKLKAAAEAESARKKALKEKALAAASNQFKSFFSPVEKVNQKNKDMNGNSPARNLLTIIDDDNDGKPSAFSGPNPYFKPFEIMEDMEISSLCPKKNISREVIDQRLADGNNKSSSELLAFHVGNWRKNRKVNSIETKEFASDCEDELSCLKYLHFAENIRPPYYGTWSKKTKLISGRRPLGKDTTLFDYDVDSEEEWEEEPGESLSQSEHEDDGSDCESETDGFVVPHGYLSEGEGGKEKDDEEVEAELKEMFVIPEDELLPEVEVEAKGKSKKRRRKKCKVLVPCAAGPIFNSEVPESNEENGKEVELLKKIVGLKAAGIEQSNAHIKIFNIPESEWPWNREPLLKPCKGTNGSTKNLKSSKSSKSSISAADPIPEKLVPTIAKFVHGKTIGKKDLFRKVFANFSDDGKLFTFAQIEPTIIPMTTRERTKNGILWLLKKKLLAKYDMSGQSLTPFKRMSLASFVKGDGNGTSPSSPVTVVDADIEVEVLEPRKPAVAQVVNAIHPVTTKAVDPMSSILVKSNTSNEKAEPGKLSESKRSLNGNASLSGEAKKASESI